MKTIALIFLSLNSLFHNPTTAGEDEKAASKADLEKTLLTQEIQSLINYPDLKMTYMDRPEADIMFQLDSTQHIQIVRINTNTAELESYLSKQLSNQKVEGLESVRENIYSVHITFN
jgi:hypothetical protein